MLVMFSFIVGMLINSAATLATHIVCCHISTYKYYHISSAATSALTIHYHIVCCHTTYYHKVCCHTSSHHSLPHGLLLHQFLPFITISSAATPVITTRSTTTPALTIQYHMVCCHTSSHYSLPHGLLPHQLSPHIATDDARLAQRIWSHNCHFYLPLTLKMKHFRRSNAFSVLNISLNFPILLENLRELLQLPNDVRSSLWPMRVFL